LSLPIRARSGPVIHAGIYYPTGSRKAALCVEGKNLLYKFACRHSIPHRSMGTLIVAQNPAQVRTLQELQAQVRANSVHDCEMLIAKECERLESAVRAAAGGFYP
jgi:L-2-hydroxyglutarate oxidase LhgO